MASIPRPSTTRPTAHGIPANSRHLWTDPKAALDGTARHFFSRGEPVGSHAYYDNARATSVSPPPVLPPLRSQERYTTLSSAQAAAEIGRSATAVPRPHRRESDENYHHSSRGSGAVYPAQPTSPYTSSSSSRSSSTRYSGTNSTNSPRSSNGYHSPPPSSEASPTHSPPSIYPFKQLPPLSTSPPPQHSRHHSMGGSHLKNIADGAVTDYHQGSSRLVPARPSKRYSTQGQGYYPSSPPAGYSVGPALAGGIPPVLPRPPSVKSTSARGLGDISRSSSVRRSRTVAMDQDEASMVNALNTYR